MVVSEDDTRTADSVADGDSATVEPTPVAGQRLISALVLAMIPVVVLLALRASPYYRLNNGDPFIYVGYSNDFRGHVQRFGYTYHAVRFGLIFPLRASLLFGPVWGYFILRYLLYLVAIVPMYFVLRRHGRRYALLGPVFFVANPVSAQAILTTHPDTIVVPLFTAVVCLVVLACRYRGWPVAGFGLAIGLIAGVAVNANIFFAPILAVTLTVAGVVLLRQRRYLDVVRIAATSVAGVALVSLAGMFVYSRMFGEANIYETTINAATDISGDSMWRSPSLEWMTTRRYIYAPPIAVLLGGVALWRRRRDPEDRIERSLIVAIAAAALLAFVLHQFALDGNSIETSYYYSYLIGPTCLVTASAIAWMRGWDRGLGWALLLAFPVGAAYVSQLVELRMVVVYLVLTAALCAVVVSPKPVAAAMAALVAMNVAWGAAPRTIAAIPGAGFQYEPHYEASFGEVDERGYDVYRVATELPEAVPADPAFAVPMRFWYRTGDADLDSVQATYHWETSTVQRSPAVGMPLLESSDIETLKALIGGFVVLLAHTPEEVADGVDSLSEADFTLGPLPPIERFQHGDVTIYAQAINLLVGPTP